MTRTPRPIMLLAFVLAVTAASAHEAHAQRVEASRFVPPPMHATQLSLTADTAAQPSFQRIAAHTLGYALLGGMVGGAVGGLTGALLAGDSEEGAYAVIGVGFLGVAIGYPVGGAIGARKGATVDGRRPPFTPIMVASALGAVATGLLISATAGSSGGELVGLGAGIAIHTAITATVAQRAAR